MNRLVLIALLFCACTAETRQSVHERPPQKSAGTYLASQDNDFLNRAAQGSNAEIAIGALARTHTSRADVIAFGEQMVRDHSAANARLSVIAASKHITLPTSLGDNQQGFDRVADLRGEDFDREFIKVMVDDHNGASLLFKGEAEGGADPDLRAFAASTLPVIEAHLQHAKSIAATVPDQTQSR